MPQTIRPLASDRLEPGRLDPPEGVAQMVGKREHVVELAARVDRADRRERVAHAATSASTVSRG